MYRLSPPSRPVCGAGNRGCQRFWELYVRASVIVDVFLQLPSSYEEHAFFYLFTCFVHVPSPSVVFEQTANSWRRGNRVCGIAPFVLVFTFNGHGMFTDSTLLSQASNCP